MKLRIKVPRILLSRQFPALFVSLLFASWESALLLPQFSNAASMDGRSTGLSNECNDSGCLVAISGARELGRCPLKHTDVKANVSGYVARVTVKQQFHNPFKEKIEAVYTFPLPENAAVDEMTMRIGNRVIKGSIKKRDEAKEIYEAAKARGNVASLLDQERPNIFTQAVANIEPGENVDIEIKYVNVLKYEDGTFTFAFPTVVGPRFIPRSAPAYKNDLIPDASKITPPAAPEGERAGHDISIDLNINAGVPIQSFKSKLHDVESQITAGTMAHMKLKSKDKIPNKDFIATWSVASDAVQSGYLTHREGNDGFFNLMLIPPKRVTPRGLQPKEMIFVVDCSGSQAGAPIQKAKETLEYIAKHMNPNDTFQIITFNNGVQTLSDLPIHASAASKQEALDFINNIQAAGGTWMAPAVKKACTIPNDEHRLRIITFMTDGYVGNDMEILDLIKTYRGQSRWFSFGTGNSVNRFLIDGIAREGGGEADYVLLNSSAEEVGKKFYDRISSPVLTDINIAFEGVTVKEVFPKDLSDLWAQRPLNFTGRYLKPGTGKVILTGWSGGKAYRQELKIDLPASQAANDVLPSIWARAKVERLMHENWRGVQSGNLNAELKDEITATALKYHIMSQYTSFVAVEENSKTSADKAKTVNVEVEQAQGVHPESFSAPSRQRALSRGLNLPGARLNASSAYSNGWAGSAAAPAPLRSGATTSLQNYNHYPAGTYAQESSHSSLPQVNYGKFIHQPGDNQYQPAAIPYGQVYGGSARSQSSTNGVHGNLMGRSLPSTNLSSAVSKPESSWSSGPISTSSNKESEGSGSGYGQIGGELITRTESRPRHSGNIAPYRQELIRHISVHLPRELNPLDGEVVQLVIGKDGSVVSTQIIESAGNKRKDAKITAALQEMHFAPLPEWYRGEQLTFRIELEKASAQATSTAQAKTDAKPLNAGSKLDADLKLKFDTWKNAKKPNDVQKARVRVELSETPGSALLEQLHQSGLDIDKRKGATAYGTIAFKNIDRLVKIPEVKLIHLDSSK